MKRLALDVLTVVSLLAFAVVLAFWARSHFYPDILDSYHDVPAPEDGMSVPWGARREWRERTFLSFPGRLECVSVRTAVRDRWQSPAATRPALPANFVNGWWLYPRRALDWRPSSVPRPGRLWAGFGAWRESKTFDVKAAGGNYRETREVDAWGVSLPYWAPAAVLAILPVYRIVAAARRRRLRHLAYRLAVTFSGLLLLATLAAWGRSHRLAIALERSQTLDAPAATGPPQRRYQSLRLRLASGRLIGRWSDQHPGGRGPWVGDGVRYDLGQHPPNHFIPGPSSACRRLFDGFGFSLWTHRDKRPTRDPQDLVGEVLASVPCWLPAVVFGVLPCIHAWRVVKQSRGEHRARRGLCRRCGYDLRASTERCPECGEVVTPSGRTAAPATG